MLETVVYLGPSLSRAEAERNLHATYRPPICRGDLLKLPDTVRSVGIIDGEFFQSLAVSPKEIVALLDRGVRVFGASSMGALRAAETHTLGVIGIGAIFAMFRDGVLDGDDEVALVYEAQTYRHLSEPLVNLRHVVAIAVERGIVSSREHDRVIAELKRCYFPERSYRTLERVCPALKGFLREAALPDLKREDALQLLRTLREQDRAAGRRLATV